MYAAVVNRFDQAPTYEKFTLPEPASPDEALVEVIASGLHPRVRSQASGSHYTSTDELPLIPGIDGVGRLASGELIYFILPDTSLGAMAQQALVDVRRTIELPDGVDPLVIAAGMNPGMSSWVALRKRIDFAPGQSVLVLGATGSAGQMAVQIAKHSGTSYVIGAGRDAARLSALAYLGADEVVSLDGDPDEVAKRLGEAASDVDVVIDYLWGPPAEAAMVALVTGRTDRGKALNWVQIGSVAGPTAQIPSAALRAANLRIVGSGQGSVSTRDILAELPSLAAEIGRGTFTLNVQPVPLAEVERAWSQPMAGDERIVIVP
jgi:NADPH:quinone reductase-like Zn-dependent oxidoreductase